MSKLGAIRALRWTKSRGAYYSKHLWHVYKRKTGGWGLDIGGGKLVKRNTLKEIFDAADRRFEGNKVCPECRGKGVIYLISEPKVGQLAGYIRECITCEGNGVVRRGK